MVKKPKSPSPVPGPGRPRMIADRVSLVVYVPAEMRADLERIAADRGVSVSELAREAFAKVIEREARK